MRAALALSLACLAGCFDSLVHSPCATGYRFAAGACVPLDGDGGPDGGTDGGDGGSGLVCESPLVACEGACLELSMNPDHCGSCGRACASGVCVAGECTGGLPGHVVAIGHDYRRHHGAMARVLGNAVALAPVASVVVTRLPGVASAQVTAALQSSLSAIGRPWREVSPPPPSAGALRGIDVLLIEAQQGDGASASSLGASWAVALPSFFSRGGVVIALHGAGAQTHLFSEAAGLYSISAPELATGAQALVVSPSDAVVQAVVSPYLAEDSSVTLPGAPRPAIATSGGGAVVFHLTR